MAVVNFCLFLFRLSTLFYVILVGHESLLNSFRARSCVSFKLIF